MPAEKKPMSWSKAMSINRRAFQLLCRLYPKELLSKLLSVLWEALTPYVGIYLSAQVINALSDARPREELIGLVLLTLGSAALISLVSALLSMWKETQTAGQWHKTQQILAAKMLDIDFATADDPHTAEMLSTIRQNMNGGGWGLNLAMADFEQLVSTVFTIAGGLTLTVSLFTTQVPAGPLTVLNHPLTVLCVLALMLAITSLSPVLVNQAGAYIARYAGSHNLANRMISFYGRLGHNREIATDVRIYRQERIADRVNRDKEDTFGSSGLFARLSRGPVGAYDAAGTALSMLFPGLVYAFVCLKALGGAFGLGSVTQYATSITKVSGGLSGLIQVLGQMRNNASFLDLIFQYLDLPNAMAQGELPVDPDPGKTYQVEFRDVSFRYPGSGTWALRHVNMTFSIGKRLAVVGMNGSGKTTFIKLLCRLYDPTEGQILLNGTDIRRYRYEDYQKLFAVVFQDFKLLSLKLGENVAAGSPYPEDKVVSCLQKAGFGEKLAQLGTGTETYLYKDYEKGGTDISGGEAQKIAIARALYRDAPFIVLDEPTAALDPVAEADIYSKFDEITGSKTAIYISHRLSSCKFCDAIAVFHEGSVIQQGTHETLLADTQGKYHELWSAQAQYYTAS